MASWSCTLAIWNISASIVLHGDLPYVDSITMDAFAGPLWAAADIIWQNLFKFSPALCNILPLAVPWPPRTDRNADNLVNPMYTVFSIIRFVIPLVIKLLLLVVKLKWQETVSVSSAGGISSSSNQICSMKLDSAVSILYVHHPCLWTSISAQCNCLKKHCFALPSYDIRVREYQGYGD